MALEERRVVDRLEVLRDGTVQVREAIEVLRDGELLASKYHRTVVPIEKDDPDLSDLPPEAQAVVNAARTPERRAAAIARRDSQGGQPE